MKLLARNRKVRFNYEIVETWIAGLSLMGWEVKSLKDRRVTLTDAYCYLKDGELFVRNLRIAAWSQMGDFEKKLIGHDIKLLLKRSELDRMAGKLQNKSNGLTVVPQAVLLERGLVKLEICLVRGRKSYDKREQVKTRELARELKQTTKQTW